MQFVKKHFTRWQIRRNLYEGPHLTLPLNLTVTEIIQNLVRTYEFVQISHLIKYIWNATEIALE